MSQFSPTLKNDGTAPNNDDAARRTARSPRLGGFNRTFALIEIKRRLRNRRTLIFSILLPVGMFLLIGMRVRDIPLDPTRPLAQGGYSVAAHVLLSMLVYGCMLTGTSAGGAVAIERQQGWSRQLRLTPLNPLANIAIKMVSAVILSLITILALFIAGLLVGVKLPLSAWLVGTGVGILAAVVFSALGLLAGYLLPSENVMQIMGAVIAFLALFGGLFMPLTGWMLQIGAWTPTYGLGMLARAPIEPQADFWSVLNVIAWFAIFMIGAALAFRKDTKRV